MKKNLLFLLMAVFTLGFVACSDDDDETPDYAKEIAGTYNGEIKVSAAGQPLGEPANDNVYITRTDNNKVNLELKDFKFGEIPVGDITVVTTVSADGKNTLSGTAKQIEIMKTMLGGPLKADVVVEGTIVNGKADLTIHVDAPLNPGTPAVKILVTFSGTIKK